MKTPVINLITDFNIGKETMYTKLKDGNILSYRMTRGSGLESNYYFGKRNREF